MYDSKIYCSCFQLVRHTKIAAGDARDKTEKEEKSITTVLTLQSIIDKTFKQELQDYKKTGHHLKKGDPVLAQMSGYVAWPARIEDFTKNGKRLKCYFYGTHDRGTVDATRAIPFANGFQSIRLINLRKKIGPMRDFAKGIKELEIEQNVPENLSSLRDFDTIE